MKNLEQEIIIAYEEMKKAHDNKNYVKEVAIGEYIVLLENEILDRKYKSG